MTDGTNQFPGVGFEHDDFSPEERASLRNMMHVMNKTYRNVSLHQLETLRKIDIVIRAWPIYAAMISAGAMAKTWGLF